jgi:hypothetical protein
VTLLKPFELALQFVDARYCCSPLRRTNTVCLGDRFALKLESAKLCDYPQASAIAGPSGSGGCKACLQKSGFSMQASSLGCFVLVVPVQYSRCWTVSGKGDPVPFRANRMHLGVSRTGKLDANPEFRFGPVLASRCRIEGIRDMERLRIREARGSTSQKRRGTAPVKLLVSRQVNANERG